MRIRVGFILGYPKVTQKIQMTVAGDVRVPGTIMKATDV